jgi:hypothetical protein
MSRQWADSNRRSELPKDWDATVKRIKLRDGGRCRHMAHGFRCTNRGTECDHIGDPLDHSDANLQMLCKGHHRAKTYRERQAKRVTPIPRHPGDLRR